MAVRPLWDLRQATLAVFTGGGTCQSSSLPISTSVGWGGGGFRPASVQMSGV